MQTMGQLFFAHWSSAYRRLEDEQITEELHNHTGSVTVLKRSTQLIKEIGNSSKIHCEATQACIHVATLEFEDGLPGEHYERRNKKLGDDI